MKKHIQTQIEINASSRVIWQILSSFEEYPEWNPFITSISGTLEEGKRLQVYIDGMKFSPIVQKTVPNKSLMWLGNLFIPGLFDGQHIFEIEELAPNRSILHHEEKFSGLLVPFLSRQLDGKTKEGFEAMNVALKRRAEQIDVKLMPSTLMP